MSSVVRPIKLNEMLAKHEEDVAKGWKRTYHTSGIRALDAAITGFPAQVVSTVGAREGTGKSVMALTIARNVAVPTLWCSYEDPWRLTAERAGSLRNEHVEFTTKLRDVDAVVKLMPDYKVVLVDYLQLMQSRGQADERLRIVDVITKLSDAAKECPETAVVVFAQLTRVDPKAGDNALPDLASLANSSEVAKRSKLVLLLHRPATAEYQRRMDILVRKNNFGPAGAVVKVTFDGAAGNIY